MPYQVALAIMAGVRPGETEALKQVLTSMNDDAANNHTIPFGRFARLHFARLMVLDESTDLHGATIEPCLLFMCDYDAPLEQNLKELVEVAGDGLDKIFCYCEDYPAGEITREKRLAYLRSKMVKVNLFYVNTAGRSVQQVQQEAQLRDAISDFLDRSGQDWSDQNPLKVRAAIQSFVRNSPELRWAEKPAAAPGLLFQVREILHLIGMPLLLLIFFPFVVLAFLIWLALLRFHELTDPVPAIKLDPARVRELANLEDFIVQNQFATVGYVKPGWFWQMTTKANFWFTGYAARHIYNKGDLAGLKTVHFGHLMSINEDRRVVFTSYYDGSLESYMDDFIDKVAWVLNTAFGNILGYPRTRWLVLDGARDERGFKNYNRGHQVITQVWYSAYGNLSAINIGNNAKLRAGLFSKMDAAGAQEWLRLL